MYIWVQNEQKNTFEMSAISQLLIPQIPGKQTVACNIKMHVVYIKCFLFQKYDILHCIILTQVAQHPKNYSTELNMFFWQETLLLVMYTESG